MAVARSGRGLSGAARQIRALIRKNALLALRNKQATAMQVFASFFFMLLTFLVNEALMASQDNNTRGVDLYHPAPQTVTGIPDCRDDMYLKKDRCLSLLYSPAGDPAVEEIVAGIAKHNLPKAIPADQIKGFASPEAVDDYLKANPETGLAAVHFEVAPGGKSVKFMAQNNSTVKFFRGGFQDPNMFAQLPTQVAVEREAVRYLRRQAGQSDTLEWSVGIQEFAHPGLEEDSMIAGIAGLFLFAASMFGAVIQITNVVSEKEAGMRQAMKNFGLIDSLYWISWMVWEAGIVAISALSLCVFGLVFQFDLFRNNSFGLTFFLFFLFMLAMTSFAFFVSTLLKSTAGATTAGFAIFVVGWIFNTVVGDFGFPFSANVFYGDNGELYYALFLLLPWNPFSKGMRDLGRATPTPDSPGLAWSERDSYCRNPRRDGAPLFDPDRYINNNCVLSLGEVYGYLACLWLGYFVLAIYFDQVVADKNGVKRSPLFFLHPNYWRGGAPSLRFLPADGAEDGAPPAHVVGDEDVEAEWRKMQARLRQVRQAGALPEDLDGKFALQLYGLQKQFRPAMRVRGDFWRKREPFHAVKGSWFAVGEGEVFCLLGPNGAGKTTTINCLTGVLPPSGGEAVIHDEPLRSPGGLDRIRANMGVCPQFDALWPQLTGQEHLEVFGMIKGASLAEAREEATSLLELCHLGPAAHQTAGGYSGGMKRRLSVALALIGNPAVVYLDEPTTGMDPVTRRHVWDIIENAKQDKVVVLTTHSMEEADVLGDRIAIMAKGAVKCIGTSLRLKTRFGAGYRLAVSLEADALQGSSNTDLAGLDRAYSTIKAFFRTHLGIEPVEVTKAFIQYEVPRSEDARLRETLAQLEQRRGELGIRELQLSLATLEDVFLNIARQAELEAAKASGKKVVARLPGPGPAEDVKIVLGCEDFEHAGARYAVSWNQDDQGSLVVNEITRCD